MGVLAVKAVAQDDQVTFGQEDPAFVEGLDFAYLDQAYAQVRDSAEGQVEFV